MIFNTNIEEIGVMIYHINSYYKQYDINFYIDPTIFMYKDYTNLIIFLDNNYFKPIKCCILNIMDVLTDLENDFS